jgi:hypothetical protein
VLSFLTSLPPQMPSFLTFLLSSHSFLPHIPSFPPLLSSISEKVGQLSSVENMSLANNFVTPPSRSFSPASLSPPSLQILSRLTFLFLAPLR